MLNHKFLQAVSTICGQPGSEGWAEKVCERLRKIDAVKERVESLDAKRKTFKEELKNLDKLMEGIQNSCNHEVLQHHERGDAQDNDWDECLICGKQISDNWRRS